MNNAAFGNELQYAMKYYDIGYGVSQGSIFWNDGEQQSSKAISAYMNNAKIRDDIVHSPLYQAIRDGLKKRFNLSVESDWCGWQGEQIVKDGIGITKINHAIEVLLKDQMPIRGMIGAGVSDKQVEFAKQVIQGYGIEGVFVEVPGNDLLKKFHKRYGSKPASHLSELVAKFR